MRNSQFFSISATILKKTYLFTIIWSHIVTYFYRCIGAQRKNLRSKLYKIVFCQR